MTPRLSELKTIIFDLGEVIVDLDPQAVIDRFSQLTNADGRQIRDLIVQSNYLYEYETGQMTDSEFVAAVNDLFKAEVSENDFRNAWNLMIKGITERRLQFMKKLMNTHQVLLLSNTNRMHELYFDELVKEISGKVMKDFAHKAYYSHYIGYRKPEGIIYEHVIDEQGLDPQNSLFLDDRSENIAAAKEVGLKAVQVAFPDQIFELLKDE